MHVGSIPHQVTLLPPNSLINTRMLLTKATRRSWFVRSEAAADPRGVAPKVSPSLCGVPRQGQGPGTGRDPQPLPAIAGATCQPCSDGVRSGCVSRRPRVCWNTGGAVEECRHSAKHQLWGKANMLHLLHCSSWHPWPPPPPALATGTGEHIQGMKGRKDDFAGSSLSQRGSSWRAGRMLAASTLPVSVLVCWKHSNCCSSLLGNTASSQCEGWFVSF